MTRIKNREIFTSSPLRQHAYEILETMYAAIDTVLALEASVSVRDSTLWIKNTAYPLENYDRVFVIGFGKASCDAAVALEKILKNSITEGVMLDVGTALCEVIDVLPGTHPLPSLQNVTNTERIMKIAKDANERDLVIVVVSGGGSALLCASPTECDQNQRLYEAFLSVGGSITELNIIRKHLSALKGGGLAALLHPATIVGLIFSDVPGGELSDVASGPTYPDETTIDDARRILEKYHLTDQFTLSETPKDPTIFQNVYNTGLVTSDQALRALATKAEELGYAPILLSSKLYADADTTVNEFIKAARPKTAVIGGGEIALKVPKVHGQGGRNEFLTLTALERLPKTGLFISVASDGRDNTDAAGAIADSLTLKKASAKGLSVTDFKTNFDAYRFFAETGDLIMTGSTGANVADIMIYLSE